MIISTQTDNLARRFGEHEAIKMIAEAGFDAVDYSMFSLGRTDCILTGDGYKDHVLSMKKTADECGVFFNQAHAPFPSFKFGNPDGYNDMIYPAIIRSIEVSGLLGIKQVIVHPFVMPENQKQINLDFYNSLIPYAKKARVKIALENMFGWSDEFSKIIPNICSFGDEFREYMDCLDPEYFTACLDIGHAGLTGDNAPSMIRSLGKTLGALHVHDNNGISDLHTLPFTQKIRWESVIEALLEVGYCGQFTFEADTFIAKMPDGLVKPALKFMAEVGRYFADRIGGK